VKAAKLSAPGLDPLTGDAVSLERKRALLRAVDETYFKVPLGSGYSVYEGAVVEVKNGDAFVMQFPAGAPTRANRMVEARALWALTRPRLDVWYSSPGGSVVPFNFGFVVRVYGAGSTTVNNTMTIDWTAPGPAAAGGVLKTTVVGTARFPASPFGVAHFRLVRNRLANDANPNALDVLLAVVTMEEVA